MEFQQTQLPNGLKIVAEINDLIFGKAKVACADFITNADLAGCTDDAAVVEQLGECVFTVLGDPCNIKVTTPADLKLVRAILGVRPPAERPIHKRF